MALRVRPCEHIDLQGSSVMYYCISTVSEVEPSGCLCQLLFTGISFRYSQSGMTRATTVSLRIRNKRFDKST